MRGDADTAMYYLDGAFLGEGEAGIEELLKRMVALPPKSRIIFWFEDVDGFGMAYRPPYSNHIGPIMDTAAAAALFVGEPTGPWTVMRPVQNKRYFTYGPTTR
jgi:hypothetical protein